MGVRRHHHAGPARLRVRPRAAPRGRAAAAPLRGAAVALRPVGTLAVDLGKTGCRAALWHQGERREADGPGAPGLAFADGVENAVAAILAVASGLDVPPGAAVGVGAAGALGAPERAAALAGQLCAALRANSVAVASDAVTAHAGALAGGPGVLLAVGTGAVAVAVGPGGFVRADGHGPWLGDEGSGAAIGLAGLRAVLRAADGRGPATALTDAAARCYGAPASALPLLVGNTPDTARLAARFAGPVVAAAGQGDPAACAIVEDAARSLAAAVRAAAARSGLPAPAPAVLAGGVLRTGPAFTERLHAAISAATTVRIVPAAGTALDGARRLASDRGTLHEPHVMRRAAEA